MIASLPCALEDSAVPTAQPLLFSGLYTQFAGLLAFLFSLASWGRVTIVKELSWIWILKLKTIMTSYTSIFFKTQLHSKGIKMYHYVDNFKHNQTVFVSCVGLLWKNVTRQSKFWASLTLYIQCKQGNVCMSVFAFTCTKCTCAIPLNISDMLADGVKPLEAERIANKWPVLETFIVASLAAILIIVLSLCSSWKEALHK